MSGVEAGAGAGMTWEINNLTCKYLSILVEGIEVLYMVVLHHGLMFAKIFLVCKEKKKQYKNCNSL